MRKCLLLFFFLIVSLIFLKVNEKGEINDQNSTAVEELVDETTDDQIVKN